MVVDAAFDCEQLGASSPRRLTKGTICMQEPELACLLDVGYLAAVVVACHLPPIPTQGELKLGVAEDTSFNSHSVKLLLLDNGQPTSPVPRQRRSHMMANGAIPRTASLSPQAVCSQPEINVWLHYCALPCPH